MKKLLFIIFSLLTVSLFAQVNETAIERYLWTKKGTEPQDGYVILKSGKRMDGMIQLKGSIGEIKKIILVKDGKEIELDLASLSAYGLNIGPLYNDSPEEMYEWKNGSTSTMNGKTTVNTFTKDKKGYVILNNGKRIEGMLHLNSENGILDEIVVKNEVDGKQVFKPAHVAHYGLNPTIADLTKNGKKVYDDEGKNFKNGYAIKSDDAKITGMLAFMKSKDIPNSDAVHYQTVYYTANETEPVSVIETEALKKVVQMKGDTEIVYLPYNGGFVEQSKIESLSINELFKLFQPGKITKSDKSVLSGEIAQMYNPGEEFSAKIKFKGSDGTSVEFSPAEIIAFEQNVKGANYRFIAGTDRFIRLLFDGQIFSYYKNPNPTSINQKATNWARSGSAMAGTVASTAMVESMHGVSDENKKNLQNSIATSSNEELNAASNKIGDVKSSGAVTQEMKKDMNKAQGAMAAQSIANAAQSIVIYNVEFIVLNKKSGEKMTVIKSDFSDTIEPLLKSCEDYLLLSKSEQKKYRQIENFQMSMNMLDKCYSNVK